MADLKEPGLKHVQDVLGLGHNPDMKQPKFYNLFHDTNFAALEASFRERNSFALLLDYLADPAENAVMAENGCCTCLGVVGCEEVTGRGNETKVCL
ncbi:hypothetical protein ACVXHB_30220 [Escherichia coli]